MDKDYQKLKDIIDRSKRIVFFGGAGVSTESGIPDFRSESGLYNGMKNYGYSPEVMLSHSFFVRETETFFNYYKNNLIYPKVEPNDAHIALAKWEEDGIVNAVVTQNIDGLHQLAGSRHVCELHGSVQRNNCMDCGAYYDLDYVMDSGNCKEKDGKESVIPRCQKCGGIVKPNVVLYEEPLNQDVMNDAVKSISRADTIIVGGTSLVVYPAAGLLNYFNGSNLVLINKSETSYDNTANLVIHEAIGKVFKACLDT